MSDTVPHAPGTVRSLTCCCCAEHAGRWAQHWNRDIGFGLCGACAVRLAATVNPDEMRSRYGEPGVNYPAPPAPSAPLPPVAAAVHATAAQTARDLVAGYRLSIDDTGALSPQLARLTYNITQALIAATIIVVAGKDT